MERYFELTIAQRMIMNTVNFALKKSKMSESNIFLDMFFQVKHHCNFDALEKAYDFIMKNNDTLRLFFFKKGFKMYQKILPWNKHKPEKIFLEDQKAFEDFYLNLNQNHIPVINNNPIRCFLVRVGDSGALVFRIHHLLIDGYGANLLLKQIETFYSNEVEGKQTDIQSVSIEKYFEINEKYCKNRIKKDREYWKKVHFNQKHYHSVLPYCGAQSSLISHYEIDEERYNRLKNCLGEISEKKMTSIQSLISYLLGLTIFRLSGKTNFAISHLSHGRRHFSLKNCIGNMAELIPAYFDIKMDDSAISNFYLYNDHYYKNLSHGQLPLSDHLFLITPTAVKDKLNYQHFWWLQFSSMEELDELEKENYGVNIKESSYMRYPFYIGMYERPNNTISFVLEHQKKRFPREKTNHYWKVFLDTVDWFIINRDDRTATILQSFEVINFK